MYNANDVHEDKNQDAALKHRQETRERQEQSDAQSQSDDAGSGIPEVLPEGTNDNGVMDELSQENIGLDPTSETQISYDKRSNSNKHGDAPCACAATDDLVASDGRKTIPQREPFTNDPRLVKTSHDSTAGSATTAVSNIGECDFNNNQDDTPNSRPVLILPDEPSHSLPEKALDASENFLNDEVCRASVCVPPASDSLDTGGLKTSTSIAEVDRTTPRLHRLAESHRLEASPESHYLDTTIAQPGVYAIPGIRAQDHIDQSEHENSSLHVNPSEAEEECTVPIITATLIENVLTVVATPSASVDAMVRDRLYDGCRFGNIRCSRVALGILAFFAAVVAVVVPVALHLNKTSAVPIHESATSRGSTGQPPTESSGGGDRVPSLEKILATVSDPHALADPQTPQYHALRWIANEDGAVLPLSDVEHIIQRYILAVLYNSTEGKKWFFQYEFLSEDHECTWRSRDDSGSVHGVERCDAYEHITDLELNENGLVGSFPSEIAKLEHLKILSMWKNRIRGTISDQFGAVVNLTTLNLSHNEFSKQIPSQLGNLGYLSKLRLTGNSLTGNIPTQINEMASLTHLSFSDNKLTGSIPQEIGRLFRLSKLYLASNKLSGSIPPSIGMLTDLSVLWYLTGSVENVCNFPGGVDVKVDKAEVQCSCCA